MVTFPPYTHQRAAVSRIACFCMLVLLLTGCMSSRSAQEPEPVVATALPADRAEVRLRALVDEWKGTRHVMGGTSRNGLDCSAFVQILYRDVYDVEVPRTTRQQVRTGYSVQRGELVAGDLVFFRPGFKQRHVGVYLSDGTFAHVSSSQGVTVSNLDEAYWRKYYWTARRLTSASTQPLADRPRGGW